MNEHPIFIPFGDEHLAAVVTLPPGQPRAAVLFLQGLGAPRSHRYQLWTRTARKLAALDIASVRMDYPEVGDSTGVFPARLNAPPVAEAETVARAVIETLGVDAMGVIGNCVGARAGLGVAIGLEQCISVCCIVPSSPKSFLMGGGRTAPHRAAKTLGYRLPRLAKVARRMLHTEGIRLRYRFVPDVAEALRGARVQFLCLGKAEMARRLESELGALSQQQDVPPADVRLIPAGNTSGMRIPIDLQDGLIDDMVAWMDETLPGRMRPSRVEAAFAQEESDDLAVEPS